MQCLVSTTSMMAKVVEDIIGLHTMYKPNKLFNSPLITLGARAKD